MNIKHVLVVLGGAAIILPSAHAYQETALADVSANKASTAKLSTKGGLKVTSGVHEIKIGGRIMYDYNKSEKNGVTDEDEFDLRRGRLFVSGKVADTWAYKVQFNVDGSGAEDVYLRYTGWGKAAQLTIGKQNMPFGLELLTSSKDISVLERSAVTERYALGRQEGVQLSGALSDNSAYGVALFKNEGDSETGFSARYAYAPIKTDVSVFHLGVAYRDVADDTALGLEAAFSQGPFHVQAEYVDGEELDHEDLSAFYVQAGYIFTGETRPYKGGVFKRVTPRGKSGAWEAVLRYEDGNGDFGDVELGKTDASAYTLGLNWYAHKNVRLGINYTDGDDNLSADEGNEFRVRFQLTF